MIDTYPMPVPMKYELAYLVISNNNVQLHTANLGLAIRVAGSLVLNGVNAHASVVNINNFQMVYDTRVEKPEPYLKDKAS